MNSEEENNELKVGTKEPSSSWCCLSFTAVKL